MSTAWTTPQDIARRVKRRWDDGSLLRAHAGGSAFEAIVMPVRGPRPSQIGDDLTAAREWVDRLRAGAGDGTRYDLEWGQIGGRSVGRTTVPQRAVVSRLEQAWALLGVAAQVRRFGVLLGLAAGQEPVRSWVLGNPHRALELGDEFERIVAAYKWLDCHRGSGRYLREISARGVDTKLAERHRSVLAAMLAVPATAPGFQAALGLRGKPELIRLRPSPGLGLPSALSELAVRVDELAELGCEPRVSIVVENEISYLSVPIPDDGVVIWGRGFDVDRVGRSRWLADRDVVYWGDLDTHGFAILDRLRTWLPQVRSVLMDRDTLLAHRDRWGSEPRPATSRLTRLTSAEGALYRELVEDVHGDRVRLEQERIDWEWVTKRLAAALAALEHG